MARAQVEGEEAIRTAQQSDLGDVPHPRRPADKRIRVVGAGAALVVDQEMAPEAGLGMQGRGDMVVPQKGSSLAVHVVEAGEGTGAAVSVSVGLVRGLVVAAFGPAQLFTGFGIDCRVC
jgi:hypothetical protein